jgi:hypothetical protein
VKVDPQHAHRRAMEVAAAEIERLSAKQADAGLKGWDGADLERYAGICQRFDNHELTWMAKLDPTRLSSELVERVTRQMEGEADGAQRAKRKRPAAD